MSKLQAQSKWFLLNDAKMSNSDVSKLFDHIEEWQQTCMASITTIVEDISPFVTNDLKRFEKFFIDWMSTGNAVSLEECILMAKQDNFVAATFFAAVGIYVWDPPCCKCQSKTKLRRVKRPSDSNSIEWR